MLKVNTTLGVIDLSGKQQRSCGNGSHTLTANAICDDGATHIAEALKLNTTLTELVLGGECVAVIVSFCKSVVQ